MPRNVCKLANTNIFPDFLKEKKTLKKELKFHDFSWKIKTLHDYHRFLFFLSTPGGVCFDNPPGS